ncbi:MAG TPA: response regulator [Gemmataceae bacterium]|nr:response regulator [Gemmataceae bacterium]
MTETNKHTILLVDDEPEILFSLRGLLRRDFEIHTAESGTEAMDVLKQHAIHVIMTDQRMPDMTGVQLLHRVAGEYPQAIRIVFTGYADIKAVIDAVNEGHIYRYITKPWDPDELLGVLRQACVAYDRLVEQQRLLRDLQSFLTSCLPLLQLSPGERATALAAAGAALLNRLERAYSQEAIQ